MYPEASGRSPMPIEMQGKSAQKDYLTTFAVSRIPDKPNTSLLNDILLDIETGFCTNSKRFFIQLAPLTLLLSPVLIFR
jgi:hypothetical protein